MLPYVILGKTHIKLLFRNAGSNEENNLITIVQNYYANAQWAETPKSWP
jgi:hypothetical protein